jgi:hypothetical protein
MTFNSKMAMSEKARWLAGYAGMLLLLLIPEFLIVGRFILKLAMADTLKIMAVFPAMFLAAGPLIYKGRMQARERCDARLITVTIVVLGLIFALTCAHYAARFGLVSPDTARGYTITAIVMTPVSGVFAYLFLRKWVRKYAR